MKTAKRKFNITGACIPSYHYMVNLDTRLAQIKEMIDDRQYFCINRGRQYGKTTTLKALKQYLSDDYIVISLDFQGVSVAEFSEEESFVKAFSREVCKRNKNVLSTEILDEFKKMQVSKTYVLADLFLVFSDWCSDSEKPIVLMIDEVDQASNNQIFLDFLAQLRVSYLDRADIPTFQSVILAGVHDIRNLKQKIRPDTEHKHNSPWNIAAPFNVDMSFSPEDIVTMLTEYENDNHTGMNITKISQLIYDYTSGYPVLVSSICKYMSESGKWDKEELLNANKELLTQKTPLFDSLINKLEDNENIRNILYNILFKGRRIPFNLDDNSIDMAFMYGFIKNNEGTVAVANRIFEVRIYNWFISLETTRSEILVEGANDKSQFINGNELNMSLIIEKFTQHFNDIYGSQTDKFKEDDGRKLFLLYLRPIINGVGNYYIEAQTRDNRRTDIIVDYCGKQYIIELKIWHGDEYNTQGEKQLSEYLEYYHINKGYLVSFNFNKSKQTGMKTLNIGDKIIVEAVV